MPRLKKSLLAWTSSVGFEPAKTTKAAKNIVRTLREYFSFKRQNAAMESPWPIDFSSPCLHDRTDSGGVANGHYFHQDLLVARRIFEAKPEKHVDVGSRVDGFVAHVAVFRQIEVIDVRPIRSEVRNILFRQDDLMDPKAALFSYCDSLSCLHALEHFGLGRYGDPIDAEGYLKGFAVLTGMLQYDGIMYLSVPIGWERVEFNGHRVFSLPRLLDLFRADFELLRFSYVDDGGYLIEAHVLTEAEIAENLNLDYGCGIFELKKRRA